MLVYLSEAHASDTWPLGSTVSVCKQSTCLQDRQEGLKLLQQAVGFDLEALFDVVAIDDMKDAFLKTYAAWPLRYFAFNDSTIAFIAQPGPDHAYSVQPLLSYLQSSKK